MWAEQLSQSLDSAFNLGRNQDSQGRQAGMELVDSGVTAELEIRDLPCPPVLANSLLCWDLGSHMKGTQVLSGLLTH